MNIPNVPKPDVPILFDRVIGQIQDTLKANLSWLDYAFGKCQRLVTVKDGANVFYPGVHIGDGDYISVLPDQMLGNLSFVVLDDPQTVNFMPHEANNIKVKYAIVFWFDLGKVFPNVSDRNLEALKAQILEVLTRKMFLNFGRINVKQIFEQSENVYKGYSLKEVDTQYMMQPFGGLRFEGEMTLMEGGC